jgi:hypothetical protein
VKTSYVVVGFTAALLCAACGDAVSPAAPLVVGPDSPAAAPAALSVPFKGRFDGTQTVTPSGPSSALVEVWTTGTATAVGRFTMELPHTVDFATATAIGTCTIVAANGDVLVASFYGQAQVGPIVSIVETATIEWGTGRFAGATGSFTIRREFDPAAGTTTGSFEGAISTRGASRR